MIASFPATFTSTMIILHRRVGGKAAAAVMAHSLLGLLGFALCVSGALSHRGAARPHDGPAAGAAVFDVVECRTVDAAPRGVAL